MGTCKEQPAARTTTEVSAVALAAAAAEFCEVGSAGASAGSAGSSSRRRLAGPGPAGCGPPQGAGQALGLRGRMPTMSTALRWMLPFRGKVSAGRRRRGPGRGDSQVQRTGEVR